MRSGYELNSSLLLRLTMSSAVLSPVSPAGSSPSSVLETNESKFWGPNSPGGSVSAQAAVLHEAPVDFTLPTIDLARWNEPEYRAQLVKETSTGAREMGFFYVKAPQAVSNFTWRNVNGTLAMCARVFEDTPEPERVKLAGPQNLETLHGYQKFGIQSGSLSKRAPSHKECLALGRPLACIKCDDELGTRKTEVEYAQCKHEPYPEQLREFPAVVNELYKSMAEVANVLLDLFSLSLGLPINFLRDLHRNPRSPLRMHHYPPMPFDPEADPTERAIAAAEHTDYGTITLLLMARNDPGGLQVWLRDSASWMDIPYRQDCMVVNIGDLLMRWTNDRYISNIHRVLMPETAIQQSVHRYSIAYFVTPARETLITPITESADEEVKYPVITAGEYSTAKRAANFKTDEQAKSPEPVAAK